MRSRWFLWLVAVLIGSALSFPPTIFAAEKKGAQPCAAGGMKEEKEEKKEKKAKKGKAKKKSEKEEMKEGAQPCAPKKK